MKKLFVTMVALVMTAMSYAQNTLVATLSHDEDITMFYGTYALRDAMNAAQSGDVINLSGGAFQAVNITKAVTLRGTGIDDAAPTYISGDFTINVPTDDANRLSFEGIRSTGTITMSGTFNSPYFVKNQFYRFYYNKNTNIKNALFVNCRITYNYYVKDNSNPNSVQFINSFVAGFDNQGTNTAATFINCIVWPCAEGSMPELSCNSQFLNCVIYHSKNYGYNLNSQLPATNIATKCVSIGYNDLFGAQAANTGNSKVEWNGWSQIFKNFAGTYSDAQTFELTDEAKTTYLGTDGTEVGMYGGVLPYDSTPSYPQITKMNVANKTTADGKLSVEIEVSAAE